MVGIYPSCTAAIAPRLRHKGLGWGGRMTDVASGPAGVFRHTEQRLRLLLLGDGVDTVGRIKGEEPRRQVIAELRRMRNAFDAVLDREESQTSRPSPGVGLEEELQHIASLRSRTYDDAHRAVPTFVTPAEAAAALTLSVSSIYKAVRSGEMRAVKLAGGKRGGLRIPTSELLRLSEARMVREITRRVPPGSRVPSHR